MSAPPELVEVLPGIAGSQAIEVRLYTDWKDLAMLRDDWDELLGRSVTDSIFLAFDFVESWSAFDPRRHDLRVITAWISGRLEGIAPLMLAEHVICSVRLRTLEFLGAPFTDYADFIYAESSVLEALWAATAHLAKESDAVYLREISSTSPTYVFLTAQSGLQCKRGEQCLIATTALTPDAPPAAFLQKPKFARHLRRHMRQLSALGGITLDYYTEPGAIDAQIGTLFQQHKERWCGTPTPSCFTNPAVESRYRNLSKSLARTGRCLLIVMRLDGVPVGCHWGFIHGNRFLLHTASRAVQYEHYYTGVVMLATVVLHLRQMNPALQSVDLCRGDEHWKQYFGAVHCVNYSFLQLRSLKAQVLMTLYFNGMELTRRHEWINRAARKFRRFLYRK